MSLLHQTLSLPYLIPQKGQGLRLRICTQRDQSCHVAQEIAGQP